MTSLKNERDQLALTIVEIQKQQFISIPENKIMR